MCHAIQHAHHKGVIHRDIKPSNVLVTLRDDGVTVVKVIDFGVAKATAQKLTEKTLFTAIGQMIGTPAYMSPEQAEMSGLDIDTRSDVYSLGVLLYELLTGTTPLDARQLRQAGYVEVQRLIREEVPPRPSTRLSTLGDSASSLAANRGMDLKGMVQTLSGDLDWVVMKREKDRNRRYATPGSFADDVEHYLRNEVVVARPPSTVYRLTKLARRNRAAVLTAAVVVAALLAGIGARYLASDPGDRAEKAALLAAAAEKEAKDDALARGAETKAVLGFVEDRIFAAARPEGLDGGLGRTVTLGKAIESALPYVDKGFADQPLIAARLRGTLGYSFYYLGNAETATELHEAARAAFSRHLGPDHPDTLMSMHHLASCYDLLGRLDDALKLREETLALRKVKLGPDDRDTLASMNNLGLSYGAVGRLRRRCQAARRDSGAIQGDARARPPRHAHLHEQSGQRLLRTRPVRRGTETA